jgi:hypothetical protein
MHFFFFFLNLIYVFSVFCCSYVFVHVSWFDEQKNTIRKKKRKKVKKKQVTEAEQERKYASDYGEENDKREVPMEFSSSDNDEFESEPEPEGISTSTSTSTSSTTVPAEPLVAACLSPYTTVYLKQCEKKHDRIMHLIAPEYILGKAHLHHLCVFAPPERFHGLRHCEMQKEHDENKKNYTIIKHATGPSAQLFFRNKFIESIYSSTYTL